MARAPPPFALTRVRRRGYFWQSVSGKGGVGKQSALPAHWKKRWGRILVLGEREGKDLALDAHREDKTSNPALCGEREGWVKGERERD